MTKIINDIEYYSKKDIMKLFNIGYGVLDNFIGKYNIKFLNIKNTFYFEKPTIDSLLPNEIKSRNANKPITITNEIKILSENMILYNNIKFKHHPIYTNYYFNSENIKIIIKKELNDFLIIKSSLYRRSSHDIVEQLSIYNTEIKKNYNVSKLILETFKSHPNHGENLWCNHFNDMPEDNNIKNLFFANHDINVKTMGLNCKINKNLYELIKYNILNEPKPNYSNIPNIMTINGIDCIKVNHPEMTNVFISIDGKYVFKNNEIKKEYARYQGPSNYRKVWLIKTDINIHHLMGWARYGYINLKETNTRFLHVNDISEDCSYFNIVLGNDVENGISQSQNTEKYKNIRRMLIKDYSNEYPDLLNKAIDMLHPDYKKLYREIEQMLIDSNNQLINS